MTNKNALLYKHVFKRAFDMVVSIFAFLLLFPIFLLVTLLLFVANNGNAFFVQSRPGKNESIFKILKFKTMNDRKDQHGDLLPDSDRLTLIGRFVRKTSLDEIPQLLNVIKGDMSLIGPRPLLVKYLPYYTESERKRFTIRPGITGWAQINGRNLADWNTRLNNDIYYVDNMSFKLDMLIIYKTIINIFISKNIVIDPRNNMLDLDDERKNLCN